MPAANNTSYTAFGGGGGNGPRIAKEVMIVFGVWLVAKTWIHKTKPPPQPPKMEGRFGRPQLVTPGSYKYKMPIPH